MAKGTDYFAYLSPVKKGSKYHRGQKPGDDIRKVINSRTISILTLGMEKRGWSKYRLAVESGVHYETIRRIMKGEAAAHWVVEYLKDMVR